MDTVTTAIATTTDRRTGRTRRRLAAVAVAVLATGGAAFGVAAGPASAMPRNPCSDARNAFRAAMNEARFWIGAADKLAAAGNGTAADQASAEANYYLGQAEGALGDMQAAC